MMNWKECTSVLNGGSRELINLDNVAKITAHPQGSSIVFVGLPDHATIVKEPPHEIVGVTL